MKRCISMIYYLLILSFVLPSGVLFKIPVKTLLSLVLLFFVLVWNRKIRLSTSTKLIFIGFASVLVWSLVAVFNGFTSSIFSFIKSYFSLIFVVWITDFLYKNNAISINKALKMFSFVSIFLVLSKILIALSLSFNIITIDLVTNIYANVFSTELTTMYFYVGKFMFYRLMLASDSIPFIWFSFYVFSKNRYRKKIALCLLMAIYALIIYSRAVLLEYLILTLAYFFVLVKKFPKSRKIVFAVGVICIFGLIFSSNSLFEILGKRFSGVSVEASDNIRTEQLSYLLKGFWNNCLIGNGTGAYVREYIRSETILYSYEMEYASFLFQFGILGFVLIILTAIVGFYLICKTNISNKYVYYVFFINLIIWIIKPLFNPNFLSSNSGILIVGLYLYGIKYGNKSTNKKLNCSYAN